MPAVAESPRLKALKSAPMDSWIVLSGEESTILATGNSFEEASMRADQLDSADDLVVLKTPKSWASFSV